MADDMFYLCANLSLPKPLNSRLRPLDRQTSDFRRASSLNAPYPRGGGIIYKSVTVTAAGGLRQCDLIDL